MTVKIRWLPLLVLSIFFTLSFSAGAATLTVTTMPDTDCTDAGNACDLPSALAYAATNGQNDVLNLQAGAYSTTSAFAYSSDENNSLTLTGQGKGVSVLTGQGTHQILSIRAIADSLADISISGITFRDGNAAANGTGLAVNTYRGDVTIDQCEFIGNAGGTGGGAWLYRAEFGYGAASVTNSSFTGNGAVYGGGLYINFDNISVQGNTFNTNMLTGPGMGPDFGDGGGAYLVSSGGTITVKDNYFTGNGNDARQNAQGGGLRMNLAGTETAVIEGNTFSQNHLGEGGSGGGLYIYKVDGPVWLLSNIFSQNAVGTEVGGSGGGGFYIATMGSFGEVIAVNNVLVNNSAGWAGGADLEVEMGATTFTNNTVTSNYTSSGPDVFLNIAGGIIYNNILWDGSLSDLYIDDFYGFGITVDLSSNIIGSMSKAATVSTGGSGANLTGTDPLIDTSGTPTDYHLPSNSPAIDMGDNNAPGLTLVTADVDGVDNRKLDGDGVGGLVVDIGADEYGGVIPDCSDDAYCNTTCPPGTDPDCATVEVCDNLVDDDFDGDVDCGDSDCVDDLACVQTSPCWDIQVVDDGAYSVDMAVDSSDNIHMCYFVPVAGSSSGIFRYATGSPDVDVEFWTREDIGVVNIESGAHCDIEVGSDDSVHIAYVLNSLTRLLYTSRGSITWDTVIVEESGVDSECALALDADNYPHISYRKPLGSALEVKHASHSGDPASFDIDTVFSTLDGVETGRWNSIVSHPSGGTFLTFFDDSGVLLERVGNYNHPSPYVFDEDSESWQPLPAEWLDFRDTDFSTYEMNKFGYSNRLAFDSEGGLRMASLMPLTWAGPQQLNVNIVVYSYYDRITQYWRSFAVDSFSSGEEEFIPENLCSRLAGNSGEDFHMVFFDSTSGSLKYINGKAILIEHEVQRKYHTEIVDIGDNAGRRAAIIVDSDEKAHVAYLVGDSEIRYARRIGCQGPILAISPSRWNYFFPVGTFRGFKLWNIGNEALELKNLEIQGQDFSFSHWFVSENDSSCDFPQECVPPLEISPDSPQLIEPGEYYEFPLFYDGSSEIVSGRFIAQSDGMTVHAELSGEKYAEAFSDNGGGLCNLSTSADVGRLIPLIALILGAFGLFWWRRKRLG